MLGWQISFFERQCNCRSNINLDKSRAKREQHGFNHLRKNSNEYFVNPKLENNWTEAATFFFKVFSHINDINKLMGDKHITLKGSKRTFFRVIYPFRGFVGSTTPV